MQAAPSTSGASNRSRRYSNHRATDDGWLRNQSSDKAIFEGRRRKNKKKQTERKRKGSGAGTDAHAPAVRRIPISDLVSLS